MAPTPVPIDVRVIAATNRDLQAAVDAGSFRRDLFYRLNVFPIRMPSLRERVEDIPLLVAYLAQRYASKMGKKINAIDKRTLELFQTYHWPGNVRELQNVVERAVILCEGATFAVDENWLLLDIAQTCPEWSCSRLSCRSGKGNDRERTDPEPRTGIRPAWCSGPPGHSPLNS